MKTVTDTVYVVSGANQDTIGFSIRTYEAEDFDNE